MSARGGHGALAASSDPRQRLTARRTPMPGTYMVALVELNQGVGQQMLVMWRDSEQNNASRRSVGTGAPPRRPPAASPPGLATGGAWEELDGRPRMRLTSMRCAGRVPEMLRVEGQAEPAAEAARRLWTGSRCCRRCARRLCAGGRGGGAQLSSATTFESIGTMFADSFGRSAPVGVPHQFERS